MKKKRSMDEIVINIIVYPGILLAALITFYPFLYIFSASLSDPAALMKGEVWVFPKGLDIGSYKLVINNKSLWTSYYNTLWYTVVGTSLNVLFTLIAAYPLSRRKFFARNFFMFLIIVTMYFGGGLIPGFLVVYNLGLFNTRWAIILPALLSSWNLIICRTFIQTNIPEELLESARIEGCSEFRMIKSIVLPLSMPIVAVLIIFYGVGHWNSFFSALIYLRDENLFPLQVFLRRLLIQYSAGNIMKEMNSATAGSYERAALAFIASMQVKYVVIMVSIIPILCIYPFLQKYFIKGVMIGSLKG